MGQQLDLMSPKCELKNFDMTLYSQIVQYKTSYYSFYLPVQLGMILAGVQNPELYRQARTILLAMGHLFQVQDDFIDCYGDPNVTGKIGTDIQDRKCSWLIVQALHIADENQRQILHVSFYRYFIRAKLGYIFIITVVIAVTVQSRVRITKPPIKVSLIKFKFGSLWRECSEP